MSNNKKCTLGRILKHKDGYGFKITLPTFTEAKKYKEAFHWYIENDGYKIEKQKGYNET